MNNHNNDQIRFLILAILIVAITVFIGERMPLFFIPYLGGLAFVGFMVSLYNLIVKK